MMLQVENEFLQSMALKYIQGEILIAGTYSGDDVRAIKSVRPEARVAVVDSFAGTADPVDKDINYETVLAGSFSIGGVERYLSYFREDFLKPDEIHQMWITSESLKEIKSRAISFLFLDLDHYSPTIACLKYFSKMLTKQSVIVVHDYGFPRCPGVKAACDEFGGVWKGVPNACFGVREFNS